MTARERVGSRVARRYLQFSPSFHAGIDGVPVDIAIRGFHSEHSSKWFCVTLRECAKSRR